MLSQNRTIGTIFKQTFDSELTSVILLNLYPPQAVSHVCLRSAIITSYFMSLVMLMKGLDRLFSAVFDQLSRIDCSPTTAPSEWAESERSCGQRREQAHSFAVRCVNLYDKREITTTVSLVAMPCVYHMKRSGLVATDRPSVRLGSSSGQRRQRTRYDSTSPCATSSLFPAWLYIYHRNRTLFLFCFVFFWTWMILRRECCAVDGSASGEAAWQTACCSTTTIWGSLNVGSSKTSQAPCTSYWLWAEPFPNL